jgi:heme o synthase
MKARLSAYLNLTKPTIILLFGVTGFAAIVVEGTLIAQPFRLICIMAAMLMTAGSANALNMYFDRDIDALMERTRRRRAIPMEKVKPEHALVFGLILGLLALLYFALDTNWLATFLSFFTIAFYVGIYTLWLKRRTPYNIVIGGAAGATAPLIGWAAATGEISWLAWTLFMLIFMWTPPHFWALAISIKEEYAKVNVPMLPVTHGVARTRLEIVIYTAILLPMSFIPVLLGDAFGIYLSAATVLAAWYGWQTWVQINVGTAQAYKRLFWVSIIYLFLLFIALIVDSFVF